MNRIQINTKKIKESLKKTVRLPAYYFFWFAILMIFWAFVFGGLIFYKYAILAQKAEVKITTPPLEFRENNYQAVLDQWQMREKRFKEADSKTYPDPFLHSSSNTVQ